MCLMEVPMPLSKRGICWHGTFLMVLRDAAGRVSAQNLFRLAYHVHHIKGNSNAKIAAEAAMQRDSRLKITIPSEVNL